MTDLPAPLPAVLDFTATYTPPDPGYTPGALHINPADRAALAAAALPPKLEAAIGGYDQHGRTFFGLSLRTDRNLPAGQWRITTTDGRLIHDSRTGKRPPEWR